MRIIQKEVLRKWKEIAEKYNVSLKTVKDIEYSIFQMVKEEMGKGVKEDLDSFKNIYIKNLGTFYVSKNKWSKINRKYDSSTKPLEK